VARAERAEQRPALALDDPAGAGGPGRVAAEQPPEKLASGVTSGVFSGIEAQEPPPAPRRSIARGLVIMAISGVLLGVAAWGATQLGGARAQPQKTPAHAEVAPTASAAVAPAGSASTTPAPPEPSAAASASAHPEGTARPVVTTRPALGPRRAQPATKPTGAGVPDDLSKNPYR